MYAGGLTTYLYAERNAWVHILPLRSFTDLMHPEMQSPSSAEGGVVSLRNYKSFKILRLRAAIRGCFAGVLLFRCEVS